MLKGKLGVNFGASAKRVADIHGGKFLSTRYRVECRGKDGKLKWVDEFDNTVVTVGLNDSLEKHLKGSGYTAAWYIGLTDGTPTVDAGDTMASHAGWAEVVAYDELVRQTATFGDVVAGSVSNSASPAVFTVSTNSTTIGGAFLASDDTKGGADGVLYGAGAFTAGDKSLDDGDTLTVTLACSASAS